MKLWILCLCLSFSTLIYASTLEINETFEYAKASPYMVFYQDKNNTQTYDSIQNVHWEPMLSTNLGGHNNFSSWTKLSLKNSSSTLKTLILKNPRASMDELDVYIVRNNHVSQHLLGDTRPLALRELPHRYSAIPLVNIAPEEEVEIITRLFNPISSTEGEWEVYSHAHFIHFALLESIWWGIFIGINLALFFYCIPILFTTKDKILITLFSLFTVSSIGHQLSTNGVFYATGITAQYTDICIIFFGILFVLSTILVILRFLKITHHNGSLHFTFRAMMVLICLQIPLLFVCIFYHEYLRVFSISALYISLLGFLSWFALFRNIRLLLKDKIFKYIFVGYTAIFITFIYQILIINGVLDMNSFSVYSFSIGSILEMYFFALGIAHYIKEIEKDKLKKDKLLDFQMRFASIGRVVGNISHQWKVPLVRASALLTHIEAILHFKQEPYYSKIEELVPEIRSYFVFMQNSIDEFYSLYSQNTHKVSFKLLPIINDVWGMLSSKVSALNANLYVKDICDTKLFSYEYSFAHILIILIDNSLDMAKLRKIQAPHIRITINTRSEFVDIIIEDNCGGISQKPIESIFDIDVSSKEESTLQGGLGLAIVQTLVNEKFNGNISVSNTDLGARFYISLPNDHSTVLSDTNA